MYVPAVLLNVRLFVTSILVVYIGESSDWFTAVVPREFLVTVILVESALSTELAKVNISEPN